jgi:hypothetical protein
MPFTSSPITHEFQEFVIFEVFIVRCVVHYLDLLLEDLGKITRVKRIVRNVKAIVYFI